MKILAVGSMFFLVRGRLITHEIMSRMFTKEVRFEDRQLCEVDSRVSEGMSLAVGSMFFLVRGRLITHEIMSCMFTKEVRLEDRERCHVDSRVSEGMFLFLSHGQMMPC